MGLVDLTTDLKSLRYGKDKIGGGSSGQPYIKTDIPDNLSDVGKTGGPDVILRGGALVPNRTAKDVSRLTQMFFDFKSIGGPLFIAKQNLLSRTSVAINGDEKFLNDGVYLPTSTLLQSGVNSIGLHLNKQGINPFIFNNENIGYNKIMKPFLSTNEKKEYGRLAELTNEVLPLTSTQAVNLFSYSGGPNSILGIGKTNIKRYSNTTENRNYTVGKFSFNKPAENVPSDLIPRDPNFAELALGGDVNTTPIKGFYKSSEYVNLRDEKLLGPINYRKFLGVSPYFISKIDGNSQSNILPRELPQNQVRITGSFKQTLDQYKTPTKGKEDSIGAQSFTGSFKSSEFQPKGETYDYNIESNASNSIVYPKITDQQISKPHKDNPLNAQVFTGSFKSSDFQPKGETYDYNLNEEISGSIKYPTIEDKQIDHTNNKVTEDFRIKTDPSTKNFRLDYTRNNIEQRVNLGNPGKRKTKKQLANYQKGLGEPLDKINSLRLYKSETVTSGKEKNDLVKFRIGIIQNDNPAEKVFIHFRAFLDSMNDSYSAEWKGDSLMGRGEKFYRYNGFGRSISLAWTVAAQSKEELIPMHQKLNYLASTLAPDYSKTIGYMRGNLVTLTVGGYLYEQPGIITGLDYSIPEESPWEIAIPTKGGSSSGRNIISDDSVKEMPHMIKVTGFNFIPIHNFTPQIQQNTFDSNGKLTSFGDQRYIALENGFDNNYDNKNYI